MSHLPYSRHTPGGSPMTTDATPTAAEVPALRMRAELAETFGRLVVAATSAVPDDDLPLLAETAGLVAELAERLAHRGRPGADDDRLERLRWAARVTGMIYRVT